MVKLSHPPPPSGTRLGLDSNTAATNERKDENREIVGVLNIIEDIISRLDSLRDPDCVEGVAIRFDILKRYLVNILVNIRIDQFQSDVVDHQCCLIAIFCPH